MELIDHLTQLSARLSRCLGYMVKETKIILMLVAAVCVVNLSSCDGKYDNAGMTEEETLRARDEINKLDSIAKELRQEEIIREKQERVETEKKEIIQHYRDAYRLIDSALGKAKHKAYLEHNRLEIRREKLKQSYIKEQISESQFDKQDVQISLEQDSLRLELSKAETQAEFERQQVAGDKNEKLHKLK